MKDKKKALIPRLRFLEFRDAGEWEVKLLGKLSNIVRGGSPRPIDKFMTDDPNGLNWLKIGDVDKEAKFVTHTEERVIQESLSKTREVNPGDLIMSNSMSFGRPYILKIKSCIHDGWIAVTKISASVDSNYLYYLILSNPSQVYFMNAAAGGGVRNLNADIIKLLTVKYPSPDEQQKIADCLSSLDALITAQTGKIDALTIHKKGLMQQLFPCEGETVPSLRFPEFREAGAWVEKPLGRVIEIASGQVDPIKPPYCDLPHVGGENIESETGAIINVRTAKELHLISGKYAFDESYILYSKIRPALNKVARPKFKGICSADIYPIRPLSSELLQDYLLYMLLTEGFLGHAKKHSDRGKIPKVNRKALMAYTPSLPIPAEQRRIANCLSSLDTLISAYSDKLDALKNHKQELMQQLFPIVEGVAS